MIQFVAAEMPDCDEGKDKKTIVAPLLQFRRRRMVEYIALRTVDEIEAVGFDRQRAALARQFRDPLDMRKSLQEIELWFSAQLVDIKQLAREQRGIGLGHVDPADALRRLQHASALGQIEDKPAGGAVIRRQDASGADALADRFDAVSQFAPADANAAHGG